MSDRGPPTAVRPGTIVLLNGTSSSGKSSLAEALQRLMPEPWLHTGIDHFLQSVPRQLFVTSDGVEPAAAPGFLLVFDRAVTRYDAGDGREGYRGGALREVRIGPVGLGLLAGMYASMAALARAGCHVIGDVVIHDRRELALAAMALADSDALFVGLRCPLEIALQRERARGNRAPGGAVAFHHLVHAHARYDLEVDTATLSPEACAREIRAALAAGRPRIALRQLAAATSRATGAS